MKITVEDASGTLISKIARLAVKFECHATDTTYNSEARGGTIHSIEIMGEPRQVANVIAVATGALK